MSKDEKENRPQPESGALGKFGPGGELAAIEDRNERGKRLNPLPSGEKELADESARFADLCQYFSQQKMDIPPSVVERLGNVSKLPTPDRIRAMQDLNRELMEYLDDVGQGPGIRQ